MEMQILVVTTDALERARLARLLLAAPGDAHTMVLRHAATPDELQHSAVALPPDLLLLRAPSCADAALGCWPSLLERMRGVPVILLSTSGAGDEQEAVRQFGAVAVIVATMFQRRQLQQLLWAVVGASRHSRRGERVRHPSDTVLAAMADAVLTTDVRGRVDYCNPAAARLLGVDEPGWQYRPVQQLMRLRDSGTQEEIEHPVLRVLATGGVARLPAGCILVRPQGGELMIDDTTAPIRNASGAICGVVMVFHDVTSEHELQSQVNHLAWHDFLTGLPNRFAAQRHLEQILAEARTRQVSLAVMYLDLDKFKAINDTLGHAAGDALLVSVAERLRGCFRGIDLISRQGGDEFIVLMAPGTARPDAAAAAQRIEAAIGLPHQIDGSEVLIGCSIGIALFPEHGDSGDLLLRHADTALRSAKSAGRHTWRFFDRSLQASLTERRQLEERVRQALNDAEFELHYQPKVRLTDGALCGCEALLRWRQPDGSWMAPERFIRCAEASGLIVPLGRWVLRQALTQAAQWARAGLAPGAIAVNVSMLELAQEDFAEYVEQQIELAGMAPAGLQLELTESALMHDMHGAAAMLQRLKRSGLSLAIDDFGTGYSSLSYLADLPIDLLKVDRSFVHGVDHANARRQSLLLAVLSLVENLGLPAVAEGIETLPEAEFLTSAGCSLGQGFYYSPAVDAATFEQRFLRAH